MSVNALPETQIVVQLHWQNLANIQQTTWVAQTVFDSEHPDDFRAWVKEITERRKDECPDGWGPLICTEGSPMFVKAAA